MKYTSIIPALLVIAIQVTEAANLTRIRTQQQEFDQQNDNSHVASEKHAGLRLGRILAEEVSSMEYTGSSPTPSPTSKSGKETPPPPPIMTAEMSMPEDPALTYSNDINMIFFGLEPAQFELEPETAAQLSMPAQTTSQQHGKARKLARRKLPM